MTYKLDPEVKKIQSPVVVRFPNGSDDMPFVNGTALADASFDKNYLIESLTAKENSIVMTLRENDQVNVVNWIGEEAVEPSFF